MEYEYFKNELYCEQVKCSDLIEKFGTPLYIYSYTHLKNQLLILEKALSEINHLICYSVKSCSNISIIKSLVYLGAGCDIVSGGELFRALKANCPPSKIVYAGVGKTKEEMEYAIKNKIYMFNIESVDEAILLNDTAGKANQKVQIALRINPDIDAKTHTHITTGKKENKFGIPYKDAVELYKKINSDFHNLIISGLHIHIGSQITELSPYIEAIDKLKTLLIQLKENNINIKVINLGGGLGIPYNNEQTISPDKYGELLKDFIFNFDKNLTLIIEPGRFISGNAAALLTKIMFVKKSDSKTFFIVDAAMNDLIRPAFYDAYHNIIPLSKSNKTKKINADVVGPICESGDFFAKDRLMPDLKQNDCIAIMSAGAYGFSMASNYNSRRKPAEILIKENEYFIIRARDSMNDLIKNEIVL